MSVWTNAVNCVFCEAAKSGVSLWARTYYGLARWLREERIPSPLACTLISHENTVPGCITHLLNLVCTLNHMKSTLNSLSRTKWCQQAQSGMALPGTWWSLGWASNAYYCRKHINSTSACAVPCGLSSFSVSEWVFSAIISAARPTRHGLARKEN